MLHYWSSEKVTFIVMMVIAGALAISGVSGKRVQYLYSGHKDNVKIMEEHEGDTCLYITDEKYLLVQNALELEHMGVVFIESPENIESLAGKINVSKDRMIVYVTDRVDQEETLKRVCETLGFTDWKPLFTSGYPVYELMR